MPRQHLAGAEFVQFASTSRASALASASASRAGIAHRERAGPTAGDLEAEGRERVGVLLHGRDFQPLAVNVRDQQRLGGMRRVEGGLERLVEDALVRRVHVDHHQAGAVLRQDVDAVQLRERVTQRGRSSSGSSTAREGAGAVRSVA